MRCSKSCYLCDFELVNLFDSRVIEQALSFTFHQWEDGMLNLYLPFMYGWCRSFIEMITPSCNRTLSHYACSRNYPAASGFAIPGKHQSARFRLVLRMRNWTRTADHFHLLRAYSIRCPPSAYTMSRCAVARGILRRFCGRFCSRVLRALRRFFGQKAVLSRAAALLKAMQFRA